MSEPRLITIPLRIARPTDVEIAALDHRLAKVDIPIADKTREPNTITALQVVRDECHRLVRTNMTKGGPALSRLDCYDIILRITGPAASARHDAELREHWQRRSTPSSAEPLARAWRAMFEELHRIRRQAALTRPGGLALQS